jgi:hypothetical protein
MTGTAKYVIALKPEHFPAPIWFTGRSIEENGAQEAYFNSDIKNAKLFTCPQIARGYFNEFALDRFPCFICEVINRE